MFLIQPPQIIYVISNKERRFVMYEERITLMKKQTNERSNYRKPRHLNLSPTQAPAGRPVRWVKLPVFSVNISNGIRDLRSIISQLKYIRFPHISPFFPLLFSS